MKVYYAHCIALYHTPQELRDLKTLEYCGFEVINPAGPEIEAQVQEVKRAFANPTRRSLEKRFHGLADDGAAVMELVFKPLLTPASIDLLVFRSLPDGRIPAGVAKEIAWADANGIPILELPSNRSSRLMTVDQTREYLKEVGQR